MSNDKTIIAAENTSFENLLSLTGERLVATGCGDAPQTPSCGRESFSKPVFSSTFDALPTYKLATVKRYTLQRTLVKTNTFMKCDRNVNFFFYKVLPNFRKLALFLHSKKKKRTVSISHRVLDTDIEEGNGEQQKKKKKGKKGKKQQKAKLEW